MRDAETVIQRFFELAAEAERIDSGLEEPVEPALEAVLDHVLTHAEFRQEFAQAFLQVAHDPDKGPPELVEYCMHALRWPEVKQELVSWLEAEDSERVRHVLRKFVMSFDDDWYHADSYTRFTK
ncbi:MAG: hypothetical protein ING36_03235 [Burkholderiales bacterium]|jgi:hypothetical protein|nr:hypothetical protein [Burkholderiales bacterium]